MKDFANRLISILLALCLMVSGLAFAEDDDEEISLEDVRTEEEIEEEETFAAFDFSSQEERIEESADEEPVDTSINPEDLELNKNLPGNVINILLVGVDTRDKNVASGMQHNDVNIVLSINKDTGELKMTSLLRDLYVEVPGYKDNKLNISYARGGGQLAMRTLNHNFDLNIQYYVAINFWGLASIIDSIGGIDIPLTKLEAGAINTYLRKHPPAYDNTDGKSRVALQRVDGIQHLDGVQAVMYARLREIDNDFHRTARQRKLLELLLEKVLSDLSIDELFDLMDSCLSYVVTNMTFSDIGSIGMAVLGSGILNKLGSDVSLIQEHRLPMDKTYGYKDINGSSVVYIGTKTTNAKSKKDTTNFKTNLEALHEFIYGSYISPETK